MADRGALRCDIETSLSEREVVEIFEDTLGKRRRAKELLTNPSNWQLVRPPADAAAAVVWVPSKREERVHAMKPHGVQDGASELHLGTTIALAFEPADGQTTARLFTSIWNAAPDGRVSPLAVMTVRSQMTRVAAAIFKRDPSARAEHYADA